MEQSPSWEAKKVLSDTQKKFPAINGAQRFITAFTRARHLSLSYAISIQSMPPSHFCNIHFNIILPSMTSIFQVASFPQVSPLKPCMHLSSLPYVLRALLISVFLTWSPEWHFVRSTENPAPLPIINELNPFHDLTSYFLKFRINIILPLVPTSLKCSLI